MLTNLLAAVPVIIIVNETAPEAGIGLGNDKQQEETNYVKFTISFYDIGEIDPSGSILKIYNIRLLYISIFVYST